MFQSPSLRGSGRFGGSMRSPAAGREGVSIPFIAGQWSLPADGAPAPRVVVTFQSPSLRGSGRFTSRSPTGGPGMTSFNPLHCGAVVASGVASRDTMSREEFHSPSLRGSGRFPQVGRGRAPGRGFQSPSLRGSGRFPGRGPRVRRGRAGFNPLHCGAVVASPGDTLAKRVQLRVSIPFIAGQWSLLVRGDPDPPG